MERKADNSHKIAMLSIYFLLGTALDVGDIMISKTALAFVVKWGKLNR